MNMSIQAINNVLPILDSLENNVSVIEAQKTLQELLKAVDEIILFQKKPEMKQYSHKMKLCSCQMARVLPPLCRVISSGTDPAFKEICHYLIAKLRWCLSEIMRIMSGGGVENDTEPSGLFVKSMENFISNINDSKGAPQDIHNFIDDLLCHALTIAKMAENEDYNEITAACRNVLTCTSGVNTIEEIDNEPLRKDTILCSLINLERKVNIAVLRLFLYVTSKFLPPLKSIIKKATSTGSRQPGDIDQELQALDLYFERVQLIGNYAVACSECKRKKLRVQSSLGSLEFLAEYIIPAAESYYMEPSNLIKRRFLQFLTDECIDELKSLTSLLDNIIDTPAFFQVLQEDLSHSIPNLKIKYSKGVYDPQESTEIVTKCYKLISHLKTTDDPLVRGNTALLNKTKEFLNVVIAHSAIARERKTSDEKRFYENLDSLIQKVEELEEHLTNAFMNRSQKHKLSQSHTSAFDIVTSTPYVPKENGIDSNSYPATPKEPSQSLDPYLNKIFETPVVRSTLYNRTPYKSLRKGTPRNLSFDISEVLESLDINYTGDVGPMGEFPPPFIEDPVADGVELEKSMYYDHDVAHSLSLGAAEFASINTLRRNLDINFLENKIKQLTTNDP